MRGVWWVTAAVLFLTWAYSFVEAWRWVARFVNAGDSRILDEYLFKDPIGLLYVSGSAFGTTLALLLGVVLATARAEPIRPARLGAAALAGLALWASTTASSLIAGSTLLLSADFPTLLGDPVIWRAIAMNGFAHVVWALIGVGLGALLRHRIAALVIAVAWSWLLDPWLMQLYPVWRLFSPNAGTVRLVLDFAWLDVPALVAMTAWGVLAALVAVAVTWRRKPVEAVAAP